MAIVKRESDYALRALARLAREEGFVPVSTLAQDERVPETFLRKIMQRLVQAGIVESCQGPFGGYRLAAPAESVTLRGVREAAQGPLVINDCFASPGVCERVEDCPLRRLLGEMQDRLNGMLDAVSLSQVVERIPSDERVSR